jgi:hypothetical protein
VKSSRNCLVAAWLSLLTGCGYHVASTTIPNVDAAGKIQPTPAKIQTIAIQPFTNITTRYKLTDRMPEAIGREFIARTHYTIISDASQADAVLRGTVIDYVAYPVIVDQSTGLATVLQINLKMQVSLTERATGRLLFSRPSFEMHERYEISPASNQKSYFDESDEGLQRLSGVVARDVVSAILSGF